MTDQQWLAATYHFPGLYSIRTPMSSQVSAQALPAPGPATVRLALIRTGIEVFGIEYTQSTLFPIIRSMLVRITPPDAIAITNQHLRAYKGCKNELTESITYREFAHSDGYLVISIRVPRFRVNEFSELLRDIGYWGQQSSFATCIRVAHSEPVAGSYGVPLTQIDSATPIRNSATTLVTEFKSPDVRWETIQPTIHHNKKEDFLELQVFVWPLHSERWSRHRLLRCHSPANYSELS